MPLAKTVLPAPKSPESPMTRPLRASRPHDSPNAPLGLMAGNLVPGQRPFGGAPIIDLDLVNSFALFSGFDPFWGLLFRTDAFGQATQSFRVPTGLTEDRGPSP